MDRRHLTALIVLGVAVVVGVGILVLGGDDSDGGADTSTTLSSDGPVNTERGDGEEGSGDGGGKGDNGDSGDSGDSGDDSSSGGSGGGGGDDEPTGPPIEQDPPGGGGGNDPVGDPADVAAVTDTITVYLRSIAAGDGDGACRQLSPSGRRRMLRKIAEAAPETLGAACPQAILLYQGAYGEAAKNPTVKSIVVSGGAATAVGPLKEPAKLSVYNGTWLIDDYGQ